MFIRSACFASLVLLSGCATIPNVEYTYYPASAATVVTVTQTVDCSADKSALHFTHTPISQTSYSSDRKKPLTLNTSALRGALIDADVKVEWYEDGRLKTINQSAVGQGEAVIKAAMTFLAPIVGGGAPAAAPNCKGIEKLGGGKPIIIVYQQALTYSEEEAAVLTLEPTSSYRMMHAEVTKLVTLPNLQLKKGQVNKLGPLARWDGQGPVAVKIMLKELTQVPIELLVNSIPTWSAQAVVPSRDTYILPIPKPQLFGKQSLTLALNEAGGVTSLGYGSTSGAAGAINSMNAAMSSDAVVAAALKSEADVIAQTQRLAACQTKPADCK